MDAGHEGADDFHCIKDPERKGKIDYSSDLSNDYALPGIAQNTVVAMLWFLESKRTHKASLELDMQFCCKI